MVKYRRRILAALLSMFLYWSIWKLVPSVIEMRPFLVRFTWQFRALLGTAGGLTLVATLGSDSFSRISLLLRIPIAFLVCYTSGSDPLIPALFTLAAIQETGFRQGAAWGGGIIGATVVAVLFTIIPDRLVFGVQVPGVDRQGLLVFLALTVPAATLAQTLRWAMDREGRWRETVDRLDLAVSRLAEANLGYQGYAQDVMGTSIADERRRISREIHDTVGYSLTNIRVMLEAATLKMNKHPEESIGLIDQSMEEAGLCLEQTRQAMRQLRGREVAVAGGLPAIQRLVKAFGDVTGISVDAEYGNVSVEWPVPVEKAVYRLVQEGMTNAFRHGMATEIIIYLWQDYDALRLVVRDNGSGSGEIQEGLGITGMRERVRALGGDVDVGPRPDGFEVRARLPLPAEPKEPKDADPSSSG